MNHSDQRYGFGTAGIELPPGIRMGGYAGRTAPASGVHDALTATALVAADDRQRVAVVALDAVAVTAELKARVLAGLPDFAERTLLLAASHTHSGPGGDQLDLLLPRQYYDDACLEAMVAAVRAAVTTAAGRLTPAMVRMRSGTIRGIASDRVLGRSGAPAPAALVEFLGTDGSLLGSVVNYACHPTVLDESNTRLSADYVAGLRSRLGAPHVLFLNGACGDLSTRFSRRACDFTEADRLGAVVAGEIGALDPCTIRGGPIAAASATVTVANRPLRGKIGVPAVGSSGPRGQEAARFAVATERRLAGRPGLEASRLPVQVLRLGPFRIVGLSVELFHRLRPDWGESVLLACYANDHHGYAVTPDAPQEAYERLATLLPDTAGGRLTTAATRLLHEMEAA